jgi:hypothetical protein
MKRTILIATLLGLISSIGFAQQQEFLQGKRVESELVGHTVYVHHPGCTDTDANFILYLAEDGKAFAKERACGVSSDHAKTMQGKWGLVGSDFCIREMGSVQNHCLKLVKIAENTYKRIDTTGVRTDWSMATRQTGNPEGF